MEYPYSLKKIFKINNISHKIINNYISVETSFNLESKPVTTVGIYRSSNSNIDNFLISFLNYLEQFDDNKPYLTAGNISTIIYLT